MTYNLSAGELDLYVPGLSYHIGATNDKKAYFKAPLGLDSNGAFVINPGLGYGYDFRENSREHGWSGNSIGLLFLDCARIPVVVVGLGPRYRSFISDNFRLILICYSNICSTTMGS